MPLLAKTKLSEGLEGSLEEHTDDLRGLIRGDLPTTLSSRVKVRFSDCDPYGHLNNARYFTYIQETRTDQLLEFYGFDQPEFTRRRKEGWVIGEQQIAYIYPCLENETIVIQTRIISLDDRNMVVEALVLDDSEKRLKSLVWARFSAINLSTGKATPHPADFRDFAEACRYKPYRYRADDFSNRARSLRSELKTIYNLRRKL